MSHAPLLALALACALPIAAPASAADGYFDDTWAGGGRITLAGDSLNPDRPSGASQVAVDRDGTLLLGGFSQGSWWIGRLHADGTPAPLFGASNGSGVVTGCALSSTFCTPDTFVGVDSMLALADGRILVLGGGWLVRTAVGAHALDGAGVVGGYGFVPSAWTLNNIGGSLSSAHSIALLPGGPVLVAGWGKYSSVATRADFALVRLLPNLALDTTFSAYVDANGVTFAGGNVAAAGPERNSWAGHAFILPNGGALLAGAADGGYAAMRFDVNGTRDLDYGAASTAYLTSPAVPLAQSASFRDRAGRLLGVASNLVMRFTAAGLPDTSFGGNGAVALAPPSSLCIDATWTSVTADSAGRILVAGHCQILSGFGSVLFLVARLHGDDGSLDSHFGIGGFAYGAFASGSSYDFVTAIILDGSGRPLLVGNSFAGPFTTSRAGAARLRYDLIFTNDLEVVPRGRLPGT